MFIIGLTSFVLINISIKASMLYAKTNAHVEPQASAMIAFKRMELEMRQSMSISTTLPTPSTWVELVMPQKDSNGLNQLTVDAQGHLQQIAGQTVDYFLGTKAQCTNTAKNLWTAHPDESGTTLLRSTDTYNAGANSYTNCRIIIDGIVNPNSPNLSGIPEIARYSLKKTLFVYTPYNDHGNPTDYDYYSPLSNTNLMNITLVVQSTLQGKPVYVPLETSFCFRNIH